MAKTMIGVMKANVANYVVCSEDIAYAIFYVSEDVQSVAYDLSTSVTKTVRGDGRTMFYTGEREDIFVYSMEAPWNAPKMLKSITARIRLTRDSNFITMQTLNKLDVILVNEDGVTESKLPCNFKLVPSEFYRRWLRPISHENVPALSRPVACVNVEIGGLPFLSQVRSSAPSQDNLLLMSNVALEGPTASHIPLKINRIYREMDDVDEQRLRVKLVDSFDGSLFPSFFVGYTAVTLHFRRTFNNFLRG